MVTDDVVAHVREDGTVLVTPAGTLPHFAGDEDDDDTFGHALDLVGADIFIAPTIELAPGRNLHVVTARALPVPGGRWAFPRELPDEAQALAVATAIAEYGGEPPALRPDWFRPGWFDRVEEWVDQALAAVGRRRTGALRVGRMWGLSAVLRVPTGGGDTWFKATCDHFHAEPAILRVVAAHFPDHVPVLLAEDDELAWMLMEPLRGATDSTRVDGAGAALADAHAELQLQSLAIRDELLAAGCPVRGVEETLADWRSLLAEYGEPGLLPTQEWDALAAVRGRIEDAVRELWDCGLPDTLCHGDLHLGNVAYDGRELRVFDWTDGCWSHPFLDGSHLAYFNQDSRDDPALARGFSEPWRAAYPAARIDRALELAPVVDLVFQAITFDNIVKGTEPASTWELGGVTARILRQLPAQVAALS